MMIAPPRAVGTNVASERRRRAKRKAMRDVGLLVRVCGPGYLCEYVAGVRGAKRDGSGACKVVRTLVCELRACRLCQLVSAQSAELAAVRH